jgi:hypothetical protein
VESNQGVPETGRFTVLDGAALVAGAAVSAVHVRGVIRSEIVGGAWVLLLGSFFWIALTAAGPFVDIFRRYLRPFPGHPRVGDTLWTLLGLPWVATTLLQSASGGNDAPRPLGVLFTTTLVMGIGLAAVTSLVVLWGTWVVVSPDKASQTFSGPWTNRVGLILAIAWPIQCGVGMVVIG